MLLLLGGETSHNANAACPLTKPVELHLQVEFTAYKYIVGISRDMKADIPHTPIVLGRQVGGSPHLIIRARKRRSILFLFKVETLDG